MVSCCNSRSLTRCRSRMILRSRGSESTLSLPRSAVLRTGCRSSPRARETNILLSLPLSANLRSSKYLPPRRAI
ncbi:hypothetical protein HanIR_Chr05g0255351 [Helianthus annuus]|nr:hypothetical protein HanIR_Chr05g0255351 [Helianthus annuus]